MLCINALPYAGMIQIRFSGSSAGAAAGRAGTLSAGVHRLPEQGDTFARHWLPVNFFKGRTPGAPCNWAAGDKLVPSLGHEPGGQPPGSPQKEARELDLPAIGSAYDYHLDARHDA